MHPSVLFNISGVAIPPAKGAFEMLTHFGLLPCQASYTVFFKAASLLDQYIFKIVQCLTWNPFGS